MAKTLSYADAARLLGGKESTLVAALDTVAGGLLLGAAPVVPAVLTLFDAKAEFARLGHELVRGIAERRSGLSRHGRTQRIEAAHSVLVVTAFFDEMAAADLPFRFADLELTRDEQERLAAAANLVARAGLAHPVPLPSPAEPEERFHHRLELYYSELARVSLAFLSGLAVAESAPDVHRLPATMEGLPARAVTRYADLSRRLAADFPEVALWSARQEHAATRATVGELASAMAGLQRLLGDISTGALPDDRRAALANAYRAALGRPIVESSDTPPGLRIPTLAEAYVQPLFRVAQVQPTIPAGDEQWWAAQPVRAGMDAFLTGHLTSPEAVVAPLLVLGQPGSGKSVLTKVMAARLPPADFLPIRVVLREVPADADLQDQIEYAVRAATGERVEWPALVRSGPDALPVVILDGFDELLQATGVSQTDYLIRIARFQQREADQGRPLAVLVTSRTSVADRARPPEGTVALRLEPFDDDRVEAWLRVWNDANAGWLAGRGLRPLDPPAVLRHRDLASQPLLLLMLALYDADGNALQRLTGDLGQGELYGRLLRNFATREVTKHRADLDDTGMARAIDEEMHRLAVVGLGMFNRGAQWITEAELEGDLAALLGRTSAAERPDMRAPLGAAEKALGRFFFIHRSQATRDGRDLRTYEFLHATFGEYLVAWIVWRALREVAAREAVAELSLSAAPVDDDRLHALLSFAPLSNRVSILGFLSEHAAALPAEQRAALAGLAIRLFHSAHHSRAGRAYERYQTRQHTVPSRHARYSANLVLLATCLKGQIRAEELFPRVEDAVEFWHWEALFWRSQLSSDEWSGISGVLALHREWQGGRRTFRLELATGEIQPPPVDPAWTYRVAGGGQRVDVYGQHRAAVVARKAYLQCGNLDDVLQHTAAPVFESLGSSVNVFRGVPGAGYASAAHLLLKALMLPLGDATPEERRELYVRCVDASASLPADEREKYVRLLFDRLATDPDVPVEVVDAILRRFEPQSVQGVYPTPDTMAAIGRCVLTFLDRTDLSPTHYGAKLVRTIRAVLQDLEPDDPEPVARMWVRFAELGLLPDRDRKFGWNGLPDLTSRWRTAKQPPDQPDQPANTREAA